VFKKILIISFIFIAFASMGFASSTITNLPDSAGVLVPTYNTLVDNGTVTQRATIAQILGLQSYIGLPASTSTSLTITGNIFHVSGATPVTTIVVPATPSYSVTNKIYIIPDSVFAILSTGNIGLATTTVTGKVLNLFYDGTKWYPSY